MHPEEFPLSTIVGLVLAAGGGRRYGGPKALVRHDGRPLVEHAVAALRDGGCAKVVVVLGAEAERVRAETGWADPAHGVRLLDNPAWKTGSGSSLRAGLAEIAAQEPGATAVAVLLVDTPGVGAEAVARVLTATDGGPKTLAAATYASRRGHPVVIGRDHWAGLSILASADVGVRAYLVAHAGDVQPVPCDDIADDTELDVPPPA